jgi:hypothetical protein
LSREGVRPENPPQQGNLNMFEANREKKPPNPSPLVEEVTVVLPEPR